MIGDGKQKKPLAMTIELNAGMQLPFERGRQGFQTAAGSKRE